MGFDNAHAIKNKNQGRKANDHRHRHAKDAGIPYEFVNAHQLIQDLWSAVDKKLKSLGIQD